MHKSLDEFESRPDPIAAHSHLKIRRHHFFSAANNQIHLKFVGYIDMHNI